ncbi:hypothetical protein [Halopiger djelfimassiliensis]|uniref:hypothetical protein n=1 Tax=Halopiger djelfimassiliensis TaxID=1293047 RepID=UPI0009DC009D|nr:hypothetical protein [Halopiger djelfimassiliensis]
MQFKPVPDPPADLDALADVRRAVPPATDAGPESDGDVDCCARVVRRTDVRDRDEAGTWLTFLRALELATEEPSGFVRTRGDLEPGRLRTAFRNRVYGASAVLETLEAADGPLSAADVVDRVRRGDSAGRSGTGDPERTERLLEWAVLFDLAERTTDGYRTAEGLE